MKKIKLFLVGLIILIMSCSKEDDNCTTKNASPILEENLCGGQALGITEFNRISTSVYVNNVFSTTESPRWNWRTYNDTIEVAGIIKMWGRADFTRHVFFKKNGSCLVYISMRDVEFDDGGVILDGNTGAVINSGYSFLNYNNLIFKLQKYKQNEILIGEVSGTKFWMEFTPDNKRTTPYDYEQYYP